MELKLDLASIDGTIKKLEKSLASLPSSIDLTDYGICLSNTGKKEKNVTFTILIIFT